MSQRFNFETTSFEGLYLVNRKPIVDGRGFFNRFFCNEEFKEVGFDQAIVQINHTLTRTRGVVRGMHFQFSPHAEKKIVTCIQGEVFDVVVDLRKGSSTYLQWYAAVLSAKNHQSLYIPEGFAHGFQTLTEDCQLFYLHSEYYMVEAEGGLNAMDPKLNIQWPLKVIGMSERDKNHPLLVEDFEGL